MTHTSDVDATLLATLSGLAGSLITATAAILGPIRLQARQAETERERHRAQIAEQQELDRRAAEQARNDNEQQTRGARVETLLDHLVELRVTTALCLDFYENLVTDLTLAQTVDYERFSQRAQELAANVRRAHSVLHKYSGSHQRGRSRDRRGQHQGLYYIGQAPFLDHIAALHTALASVIAGAGPLTPDGIDALHRALRDADTQRQTQINTMLTEINHTLGTRLQQPLPPPPREPPPAAAT